MMRKGPSLPLYLTAITRTGWNLSLRENEITETGDTPISSFYYPEESGSDELEICDATYFTGKHPFLKIKQLAKFDDQEIRKLHKKIWNEGRTPFLVIVTPSHIHVYDGYDTPPTPEEELKKIELDFFESTENDIQRLCDTLGQSKIDSGNIWKENIGLKVKTHNRVDRKLVERLKEARRILHDEGKQLPLSIVHDLLGRSLFIFYLEDRALLTSAAYPIRYPGVTDFFELLNHVEGTYALFDKLKIKFNGDLFPVSQKERSKVNQNHLQEIKRCFWGFDQRKQMATLWKMFRFDVIPIELLSSIYEDFMREEKEGVIEQKEKGAFYTKPMLVEFMLDEVLPWPDENNQRYDYKILDPACGSGIFLVESFKRLIARWKYANKKPIDEVALENILVNSIYGIDIDPEAIKVAAFSLYLTFLNYLEPTFISQKLLQDGRRKFQPLVRWKDENELKERADKNPGNNLYQFSSFEKSDVLDLKFDIIIGNPPWKRGKVDEPTHDIWLNKKMPSEIMCWYLDCMPELLSDSGIIALVSSVKVLFNTADVFEKFRKSFFRKYHFEAIINLSVVRNVMFENAGAAGAVFIYRNKNNSEETQESILYCTPKNVKAIDNGQIIVIDGSEIKFLPFREVLRKESKVFKVAMWGTMRDYSLITKLKSYKTINSTIGKNEWGIGLKIRDKLSPSGNSHLQDIDFYPIENFGKFYASRAGISPLGERHKNYRTNNKDIFKGPIVVVKEGTKDSEFCATYIENGATYPNSAMGISISDKTNNYHKALTAYFNSTIATYYYFLTSSSWGVDRNRVQNSEAVSLPNLDDFMNENNIHCLSEYVNRIIGIKSGTIFVMNPEEELEEIYKRIDKKIYDAFEITKSEKKLIKHTLNNSIALVDRYKTSGAESPTHFNKDVKVYGELFMKELNKTLKYGKKNAKIYVFDAGLVLPMQMIKIEFGNWDPPKEVEVWAGNLDRYSELMTEINKVIYHEHSHSIYYRKVFRYYKRGSIYMVKPNEKRFWTEGQALTDADIILAEMLNSTNSKA